MSDYIELDLVKVTKSNKEIIYYAVDEDTADNMMNTSSALQYVTQKDTNNYSEIQFDCEFIGKVFVKK